MAKSICSTCPVIVECLEGAIERHEPWGVWGGQMFINGKILATKRRRGRPPKLARVEDELPDIPVPVHLQSWLRSA
jgi:WhiB family redox-sensing transcriptional regulator